ncbi:hypothetical protein J2S43_005095 [Catenuloplanes nepalensis]|uniref:DUF1232 domain-containing protein n=1 Tax=Catenuloplanes nepalensis TaxID=587533 RepID=A0ABT9MYQ6_9ACTN|nr:hypothetical protein [Catenuloplanes nepalensis]MDP9796583.1 hypothetical protein [Catenuloplanes nepalensis]
MSVETRLLVAGAALLLLATLAGVIVLGFRVWKMRRMLNELGASGKFAFWGALIYTISPLDFDPILIDDLGVLAGALLYLSHLVRKVRANRRPPVQPGGPLYTPPLASPPPVAPPYVQQAPPVPTSPSHRPLPPAGPNPPVA